MVISPFLKTINTYMTDNEYLGKNVLNLVFDHKNEVDYIYTLVHNQVIFQNFKPWMDNALNKQVYMLQK